MTENYYWIVGNGVSNWLEKITSYVPDEAELKTVYKTLRLSAVNIGNDYRCADIIEIYDQEHFTKCISNHNDVSVGDVVHFVKKADINTENHYDGSSEIK